MVTATADDGQTPDAQKSGVKPKGKSDDKCIGNRRIRTIILCAILIAYCIFAFGYLLLLVEEAYDAVDVADAFGLEGYDDVLHGANLIFAGLIFSITFLIVTLLLLFIPKCDPSTYSMARLPGIGLLLGALLYIFGWVLYISARKDIIYDGLSSDAQEDWDVIWLGEFGEALLFGATVFFMGVDLLFPSRLLFESEWTRLLGNLGILLTVAILEMPAYFLQDQDGAPLVGTGYIVVFLSGLVYMVLYLFTCCRSSPGIKDKPAVRRVLAAFLLLGGVLTALGYYWYAGETDLLGESSDEAKKVAYYIGYTILAGGLCAVWALDIAWDDIKDD